MPQIRPLSDLNTNFSDITKLIHEASEPIFLTKNGYGDTVVMSIESYDTLKQKGSPLNQVEENKLIQQRTIMKQPQEKNANELKKRNSEIIGNEDF